jgi:hypothetical protein
MLLTLNGYDKRTVNYGREYPLRYPGQGHPEVNLFRRFEQLLRDAEVRRSRGVYGHQAIKMSSQAQQ